MKNKNFIKDNNLLITFLEMFRSSKKINLMPPTEFQVKELVNAIFENYFQLKSLLTIEKMNLEKGFLTGNASVIASVDTVLGKILEKNFGLIFEREIGFKQKIGSNIILNGMPSKEQINAMSDSVTHQLLTARKNFETKILEEESLVSAISQTLKKSVDDLIKYIEEGNKKEVENCLKSLAGDGLYWNGKVDFGKLYQTGEGILEIAQFFQKLFPENPKVNKIIFSTQKILKASLLKEVKTYTWEDSSMNPIPIERIFSRKYIPEGIYAGGMNFEILAKELIRTKRM